MVLVQVLRAILLAFVLWGIAGAEVIPVKNNDLLVQENGTAAKKKDILELIRVTTLQPELLDLMLPAIVQQFIPICEKADIEKVVATAKKQILSDLFLERFVAPFDENFSHEEIKTLIYFHQSEAMRKFFKSYQKVCAPIYPTFNGVIQEILGISNLDEKSRDKVVVITKANYKKEVNESKIPIVLDIYSIFCGPCKMVAPVFSKLSHEFDGKVKFAKLNVDEEFSLAQELEVYAMPTLLFIRDGKIVERHVGVIDKDSLVVKITESLF